MGFSKFSAEKPLSSTDAQGIMFRPVLKYGIKTVAQSLEL
jgi:hypothetical protein